MNGLIVQWIIATVPNNETALNLGISMSNTNYVITGTVLYDNTSARIFTVRKKTTSSFIGNIRDKNDGFYANTVMVMVIGY